MLKSDLTLHAEILEEPAFDPKVPAEQIATAVNEGIVTLTGTVPTLIAKWAAEDAVKRVQGVQGIAEELVVELPGEHRRTDSDILQAIKHRIAWDVFMPRDVQATVENGNVTVTGKADWHYQIEELDNMIRRVPGVKTLRNLVALKELPAPSQQDVKHKIQSEFSRTAALDASALEVRTQGGEVTLTGFVHSWHERDKAAQAAWSVPGVLRVYNRIVVTP